MAMRMRKRAAAVIMVAAICAVTTLAAFGGTDGMAGRAIDEAAIRRADHDWVLAARSKQVAAWLAFYTDDAVVLAPDEPMAVDRDSIRKPIAALLALPGLTIDWQPVKIEVAASGELAYLIGRYELRFDGSDGQPIRERGKLLEIWKKQTDGRWKCGVDTWNADPSVAPAADAPAAPAPAPPAAPPAAAASHSLVPVPAPIATSQGPLTPAEVMALDYGAIPTDYRRAVEQYFQKVLRYPESIDYREVTAPKQGFVKTVSGVFVGHDTYYYGWTVTATINAKNSFGGYVGFKTYTFLFRGERIVKTIAPAAEDEVN
jgi:ketosteroid isomerase-like protein